MKKICLMFFSVALLSASVFAEDATTDGLKISPLLRMKLISDFTSNQTGMDFEISGVKIEKKVTDNLSVAVMPGFLRRANIDGVTPAVGNDPLDFVLVEGYFAINDLTKSYGDYGLGLTVGQYITPFHRMEQHYQPYMFIMRPLEFRMMPSNYAELGVMLSQSFLDDVIVAYLSYVTGTGMWNGEFSPAAANDNANAGAAQLTAVFAPFKNFSDAVKELTLTFNLKSVFLAKARSNYNFLLGYKYEWLATSLEYLNTYSSDRAKDITALSFGASADVYGPFQALVRWDYADNMSWANRFDHVFLLGVNTKWFDNKLQAAITYDQQYDPQTKTTVAKRIMLATQFAY